MPVLATTETETNRSSLAITPKRPSPRHSCQRSCQMEKFPDRPCPNVYSAVLQVSHCLFKRLKTNVMTSSVFYLHLVVKNRIHLERPSSAPEESSSMVNCGPVKKLFTPFIAALIGSSFSSLGAAYGRVSNGITIPKPAEMHGLIMWLHLSLLNLLRQHMQACNCCEACIPWQLDVRELTLEHAYN